jgi:hypothetical protein
MGLPLPPNFFFPRHSMLSLMPKLSATSPASLAAELHHEGIPQALIERAAEDPAHPARKEEPIRSSGDSARRRGGGQPRLMRPKLRPVLQVHRDDKRL